MKAVRAGMSIRQAAREFGIGKSTVDLWVARTHGQRLDRADLRNRKSGRAWNRKASPVEQRIAELRAELRDSVLGESGTRAIRSVLQAEMECAPGEATINRVLARLGLRDGVRRIRRPAPPKGWYLPAVVAGHAEIDCFDFIEDLKIANGPLVDVLTAKSLHGALTDAWVLEGKSTQGTIRPLLERWRRDGLPTYAQFDNDNVFQGPPPFCKHRRRHQPVPAAYRDSRIRAAVRARDAEHDREFQRALASQAVAALPRRGRERTANALRPLHRGASCPHAIPG